MRRITLALALSLSLALFLQGCAAFKRPAPVPAPLVVHVAPAPSLPTYDFKVGPDMTACLSFEGLVAYEEEQAKLYARLAYFKTLLLQYGAIFDPPPPAKADTHP